MFKIALFIVIGFIIYAFCLLFLLAICKDSKKREEFYQELYAKMDTQKLNNSNTKKIKN